MMTPKLREPDDLLRLAADWIATQRTATIDRLRRWCDQNSWSLDSAALDKMSAMLQRDFADIGVPLEAVPLPPLRLLGDEEQWVRQATGPALIWHHNPNASRRLLLMIHYDTVYPPHSQPDRCRQQDELLIGPGTADAKGGIAVIALATAAIIKFQLAADIGLSILLNPDEEIGSTASAPLMQSLAGQFDAALLFEPTLPDGALVAQRKGSGNFAMIARGRSAHAGRNPEQGRNAIVQLAKLIPSLTQLHDPEHGVLLNVGRIVGGGPLNRVPDHAAVQFNVRVVEPQQIPSLEAKFSEIAARYSDADYKVSWQGAFHSPPKRMDDAMQRLQQRVEQAGSFAGRQIRWQDTGGACDGCKLAAFGLPNIDTMSVGGGNLHSPTEFCDLQSLVPAAQTVIVFVAGFGTEQDNP